MRRQDGVRVPPLWHVLEGRAEGDPGAIPIHLVPGPGFGDGRHPTTQLALQAIGALAPRGRPWRMLDVGSGSGILSIAAARLGATVDAVEIDPEAIAHAEKNLRANGVAERVHPSMTTRPDAGPYELVVANILRGVLLELAPAIAGHARGATLFLSGLVSTDVPEVTARYAPRLGGARPEIYERDEWRALVWRR